MIRRPRRWRGAWCKAAVLGGLALTVPPAHAHLLAAQKGTLNVVGEGAFLALSVPVSALRGVDDDGDARLSRTELDAHAAPVRAQIIQGVELRGPAGPLPFQVMLVDVAPADQTPDEPSSQLTILGRFALPPARDAAGKGAVPSLDGLSLRFSLFGRNDSEPRQDLTVTHETDTQWLRFEPAHPSHPLLPGPLAVLADYVRSGGAHVLRGVDHLLFLMIALSAGWRWRSLLGVLTCFTIGHALTLGACLLGGWSAPAGLVEPAIAATLVGMAGFDSWSRRPLRPVSPVVRLGLVFGCSLIHGLGLAEALTSLTQWPRGSRPMLWALGGFNLGIELAQLGVAALAYLAWLTWGRLTPPAWQHPVQRWLTRGVLTAGVFWFVERVLRGGML